MTQKQNRVLAQVRMMSRSIGRMIARDRAYLSDAEDVIERAILDYDERHNRLMPKSELPKAINDGVDEVLDTVDRYIDEECMSNMAGTMLSYAAGLLDDDLMRRIVTKAVKPLAAALYKKVAAKEPGRGQSPADIVARVLRAKHAFRNKRVSGNQWKWYSPAHDTKSALALKDKIQRALRMRGYTDAVVRVSGAEPADIRREEQNAKLRRQYPAAVRKARNARKAVPSMWQFGITRSRFHGPSSSVRIIVPNKSK